MVALPITSAEFRAALNPLQRSLRNLAQSHTGTGNVPTLGLCISGGPDSMALAFLLRQQQLEGSWHPFQLKGFIVDHKARAGSAEEAETVRNRLGKLGIESSIMKMVWRNADPTKLSDFESRARIKRYQMLGRKALQGDIHHLVTGHHLDDQVETVIMRLPMPGGTHLGGLQGMSEVSPIPCCESVYGAQRGSYYQANWYGNDRTKSRGLYDSSAGESEGKIRPDAPIEQPLPAFRRVDAAEEVEEHIGLYIHRPLLAFSKDRILATCKANGVDFLSDQTNFDPKHTIRNAVRYLRAKHELPRALKDDSILRLRSSAIAALEALQARAIPTFKALEGATIDFRSGMITIPITQQLQSLAVEEPLDLRHALARLTELVSPVEHAQKLLASDRILGMLKPRQGRLSEIEASEHYVLDSAAELLVLYRRMRGTTGRDEFLRLSRQPVRAPEIEKQTIYFPPSLDDEWSDWVLWDRRFWLRVKCQSSRDLKSVMVRPCEPDDLTAYRKLLDNASSKDQLKSFNRTLQEAAPGSVRYTLPVLATEKGILGFPTLAWAISTTSAAATAVNFRSCEAKYKAMTAEMSRLLVPTPNFHCS